MDTERCAVPPTYRVCACCENAAAAPSSCCRQCACACACSARCGSWFGVAGVWEAGGRGVFPHAGVSLPLRRDVLTYGNPSSPAAHSSGADSACRTGSRKRPQVVIQQRHHAPLRRVVPRHVPRSMHRRFGGFSVAACPLCCVFVSCVCTRVCAGGQSLYICVLRARVRVPSCAARRCE